MSDTGPQRQPDEAMVDLLIKQVTEGLSPAEQRELDVLDSAVASAYLRDFERAAAAIAIAGTAADAQAPPPALAARLEQQAQAFFAAAHSNVPRGNVAESTPRRPPPRALLRSGSAGWWAAAACLVLAVFGWLHTPRPLESPAAGVRGADSAAADRTALLAKPASLRLAWGATKDPAAAGVTGDVVWDPATQRGYLRFVGLAQNDPAVHQYQLWIFDADRDQRYPVDGGVFDVPANTSEVLVPIHAALPVHKPAAFAVTIEKPGGVVVSARDRVVVLAQAG
jgi:hypothetical protein